MSMTDPIADYLTRMRNAIKAKHTKVDIPYSRMKEDITKILLEYRYIQSYIKIDDDKQGMLRIYLKYDEQEKSVINALQKVTRPGLKKYVRATEIPRVLNNLGIAILSTSKGVITDRQARQYGVGGEVLCYIW
ncbi:MAG: 30S ribosomal protein S8 [candidate division KSB1 bacterium]|nr:30S ribosomal protein S8 [candidate division KSB1 bacterium]MDZ7317755.1 30S ribosomal protein S8 [candidate division KSB1 bacterium]MDZ7339975.1 30S ribosomal protein S8 [candidate division KSB1 bacterium]